MTSFFVIIVSEIVPKYMPNICILQFFEIKTTANKIIQMIDGYDPVNDAVTNVTITPAVQVV